MSRAEDKEMLAAMDDLVQVVQEALVDDSLTLDDIHEAMKKFSGYTNPDLSEKLRARRGQLDAIPQPSR